MLVIYSSTLIVPTISMTLARIVSLHSKWVRCSPKGAMSDECQDLNALHSFAVDGAPVKIPERLKCPPEPKEPYIIDLLQAAARTFFDDFMKLDPDALGVTTLPSDDAREILVKFLSTEKATMSEYEVVMMAAAFARKNGIEMRPYLGHIDFGALTAAEKHALGVQLNLSAERDPYLWNRFVILCARYSDWLTLDTALFVPRSLGRATSHTAI